MSGGKLLLYGAAGALSFAFGAAKVYGWAMDESTDTGPLLPIAAFVDVLAIGELKDSKQEKADRRARRQNARSFRR
jgi:hypothetical protein